MACMCVTLDRADVCLFVCLFVCFEKTVLSNFVRCVGCMDLSFSLRLSHNYPASVGVR